MAGRRSAGGRHPRLRPRGAGRARPGPGEGARPPDLTGSARPRARPELVAAGAFMRAVPRHPRRPERHRLPRADLPRGAAGRAAGDPRRAARPVRARLRRRVPGHRPEPGARCCQRARRRRARPDRGRRPGPVDLRASAGAEVPRHPRLPAAVPAAPTAARADVVALRDHPPLRPAAAAALARGGRRAGRDRAPSTPTPSPRSARPRPASGAFGAGRVEVLHLRHRAGRDRARRRPAAPGPPRGRRRRGREMAVLVRSGPHVASRGCAGPSARPACPVEVASDDTPLVREPAVLPLLDALRAVVDLDNDDPADLDHFGADRAEALLVSPLGGLDADRGARRWPAQLRAPGEAAAARRGAGPRPSAELLREALLDPDAARRRRRERGAAKAAGLAALLRAAARALDAGGTAEEVLWPLWAGTDWPRRLRRGVDRGGQARPAGAPRPRRGLRAVRGRRPRRGAARPHQRRRASWRRCAPSRSRPTRWPSAGCAARRSGC